MKVLKAKINWMNGCANTPRIQILVDKIPDIKFINYHKIDARYLGEIEGLVNYFTWSGKGNDGGFYGAVWDLIVDGELTKIEGAWSSRAGVMNTVFETQCVDVEITDRADAFEAGFTFCFGAVTLDKAIEAVKLIQGIDLAKEIDHHGEITYIPVKGLHFAQKVEIIQVRA